MPIKQLLRKLLLEMPDNLSADHSPNPINWAKGGGYVVTLVYCPRHYLCQMCDKHIKVTYFNVVGEDMLFIHL